MEVERKTTGVQSMAETFISITCAIYARYSSENQNDRSIEDQIRILKEFAADRGWLVLENHIYFDAAISGTSIAPRNGLKKLLEVAQRKDVPFQYILVYDTSRVARNPREALDIFEDLTYNNVYVFYTSQNIDTKNPEAKTMIALHGMTDSMLIDKISIRTYDGVKSQVLRGYSGGGRRYGYISRPEFSGKTDNYGVPIPDGYRIEINAEEATVVQRIFTYFGIKGWSVARIVNCLNKELKETGSPKPPKGKYWRVSTLVGNRKAFRGILNNEIYIGKFSWNRTAGKKNPKTGNKRPILKEPEEWLIKDRPDLRIISDDLWAEVKKRQKEINDKSNGNHEQRKRLFSKNLLTQIAVCGTCGSTFGIVSGGTYAKYGCTRNHNSGGNACSNAVKIRKEVLEEAVIAVLCRELIKKDPLSLVTKEMHAVLGSLIKDAITGRQKADIESELATVKQHLQNLGNFIMTRPKIIDMDTIERSLIEKEGRKKELENELLLYEVSYVESINIAEMITLKDLENYFSKIIDGLINPATTRETLYSVVDNVVINCNEEVSVDIEIRENIRDTISYVLDLIGKRDARVQSLSGTRSRLYTNRIFKCRILMAPDGKWLDGTDNLFIG